MNHIQPNNIIHLDGVQARPQKMASFNLENTNFELLIRKNTKINHLGKLKPSKNFTGNPIMVKINEIFHITQRINCFIKTNFNEMMNNKINKVIDYGSITDGRTYKLEVRILNFSNNEYLKKINKGDHINIISISQATVHLLVNDISDITKLDGHMSFLKLLNGNQVPSKRKLSEDSTETERKRQSI
ncbi:hypothetical protein PUN28_003777 [Cardiocondyla obscurior]|uniref:Uncharacterized protein n=1 Tax=Cardiocondyla obscurior TaxID=286306 RepID=A0AAW2GNI4_9HYME